MTKCVMINDPCRCQPDDDEPCPYGTPAQVQAALNAAIGRLNAQRLELQAERATLLERIARGGVDARRQESGPLLGLGLSEMLGPAAWLKRTPSGEYLRTAAAMADIPEADDGLARGGWIPLTAYSEMQRLLDLSTQQAAEIERLRDLLRLAADEPAIDKALALADAELHGPNVRVEPPRSGRLE